jgi:hypothetical protein
LSRFAGPKQKSSILAHKNYRETGLMAAEAITPVDQLTGLPLPILPPDVLLPKHRTDIADVHHHFHPRKDPLLQDAGGLAVRQSRVQLADYWDHHNGYHRYYHGPPLPLTEKEQFGVVIMACAGYIPDEAIDFAGVEPQIVPLRQDQRDRLWKSGELRVASTQPIQNFLTEYILGQDISHVSESKIDEFLHTTDDERKRFLGHWLLAMATEKAAEPIDKLYRMAWRHGNINPTQSAKPPNTIQKNLGNVHRRDQLVSRLHTLLVA